jgi:hypothetical protein
MDPWPVAYPGDVFTLDLRAQILAYDPQTEALEHVHSSPVVRGPNGHRVPRDLGYRGMAVFKGADDREPALYVTTVSSDSRGPGAHILRSDDGRSFEPVSEPGLGDPEVSTFRSLVPFRKRLFVTPTGQRQAWNRAGAPIVYASSSPGADPWQPASEPSFGNPANTVVFELATFADHLYAGTFNARSGFEIWKTRARSRRLPFAWRKVVDHGAHRGNLNEAATSMCAFKGALYVGSGIQNGGFDRTHGVGPAAAELIRIHPDDTWDLVVGTPRKTPDGSKLPLSGLGPGFDNPFNGYVWRMAVHKGWLYVGTFDVSVFLPYANRQRLAPWLQRSLRFVGLDDVIEREGGFDLWRSRDGVQWTNITRTGLGNPFNYGARTFVSAGTGLFVGTANPFGPAVAARVGRDWRYVPNERGGAELWLGT